MNPSYPVTITVGVMSPIHISLIAIAFRHTPLSYSIYATDLWNSTQREILLGTFGESNSTHGAIQYIKTNSPVSQQFSRMRLVINEPSPVDPFSQVEIYSLCLYASRSESIIEQIPPIPIQTPTTPVNSPQKLNKSVRQIMNKNLN